MGEDYDNVTLGYCINVQKFTPSGETFVICDADSKTYMLGVEFNNTVELRVQNEQN